VKVIFYFFVAQQEKRILSTEFDELVCRLVSARLNGSLAAVASLKQIKDVQTAYLIQDEVYKKLGTCPSFWKVGSTSKQAQRKLGTTEPGAARVPSQFCFVSGDIVPIFATHDVWVEGEFAFRLGRDLLPRKQPYTFEEVTDAIDGIAPSIEIVGSRLETGISGSGRLNITADGGANVALCIGQIVANTKTYDLPNHEVNLYVNDTKVSRGYGARALDNPIHVMVWIANHQRKTTGLKAGEVVATGTCTGLNKVGPGDNIRADFGCIGNVTVGLTDHDENLISNQEK